MDTIIIIMMVKSFGYSETIFMRYRSETCCYLLLYHETILPQNYGLILGYCCYNLDGLVGWLQQKLS